MTARGSCPEPTRWQALLEGSLAEDALAPLEAHLEACPTCQQTLEALAADRETWARAARHLAGAGPGDDDALRRLVAALEAASESTAGLVDDACAPGTDPIPGEESTLDFLSPPEDAGQLGRLGHYEVRAILGRGGMGVVLKAFDPSLCRVVAIKVMAPQLATSPTARKRFSREAQAAAAVRNEHVIDIHAVAEASGLPYLVMEYISGRSLQEVIDQSGPLELDEVLRIGMQTALGLAAAHAQGLIHRDIKPANILLENGVARVKITDFGLARAVDDATLTSSGVVAGTPAYMAPEQARGEAVDHRADLFSLGSVLYVMCTGQPPFRASGTMAVLKRVSEDAPRPLREFNPELPAGLVALIARLQAKDPADRVQTAAEAAELLRQHLARLQEPALLTPPPTRRGLRRIAASFLAALAVVGLSETTGRTRVLARFFGSRASVARTLAPVASPARAETVAPTWLEQVAASPPDAQVSAVAARLKTLNPGFDGRITPTVFHGVVRKLKLDGAQVADLSPVKALNELTALDCRTESAGMLADLSPLRGLRLKSLDCQNSRVADLSPLEGMPLESLLMFGAPIRDLAPLKSMHLNVLTLGKCSVSDLTPLKSMPLRDLTLHLTKVTDLSPLEGMPLENLWFGATPVADLSPLKGMTTLRVLSLRNTAVRDLSPLHGMVSLKSLMCRGSKVFDPDVAQQNRDVLRSLPSLLTIDDQPAADVLTPTHDEPALGP